jgi:hypothetical protein
MKKLFAAVTMYKRDDGNISVVFCGTPKTEFNYKEAFSFLNESRKAQFVKMLREADALPIYCESDNEICFRAGYTQTGELLAAIFVLGYDPEEQVILWLKDIPASIKMLNPNGSYTDVEFQKADGGFYTLNVKAEPLYPLVLKIK